MGEAKRWEGLTYQEALDRDGQPIPAIMREVRQIDLGSDPIKARRYTDPAFFRKEVDAVFLRTWQFACVEADIPNPGDTLVYDLTGHSVLITRQQDGSIKAMRNICLHRGRRLADRGGCMERFRCPYHGFTWGIDGSFQPTSPAMWDFPEIEAAKFGLGEIRVEAWAGLVFVNFNPKAPPLVDVLGPLVPHFQHWRLDRFYKSAHVGKIMHANWKVVAEAFIENFHVGTTHPQITPYTMDANSQVDLLSDHVGRVIATVAHSSGLHYQGPVLDEEEKLALINSRGARTGKVEGSPSQDGRTARRILCDGSRKALSDKLGIDYSDVVDCELIDAVSYDLFPNFHPWGGLATRLCYRFRPDGLNHERTLMEVMLFSPAPADGPPPPARLNMLGEDEPWASAKELLYFGGIIDQDAANMAAMQAGLRDLGDGEVHFGRYSELRCRNLHRMIDVYIDEYERELAGN